MVCLSGNVNQSLSGTPVFVRRQPRIALRRDFLKSDLMSPAPGAGRSRIACKQFDCTVIKRGGLCDINARVTLSQLRIFMAWGDRFVLVITTIGCGDRPRM